MAGLMELEREKHNAQAPVSAPTYAYVAPVVNNTPVMDQTPSVKEYVAPMMDSPVFTTEKYANVAINAGTATVEAQEVKEDVQAPVAPVYSVAGAMQVEESFSLTTRAKMVLGAVAATFVLMFSMVGINTQIIKNNAKQIKNLEKVRKQLMEKNEELQTRIEMAQSEETIREYALSQGMIEG